jgi:hypothetical protein
MHMELAVCILHKIANLLQSVYVKVNGQAYDVKHHYQQQQRT